MENALLKLVLCVVLCLWLAEDAKATQYSSNYGTAHAACIEKAATFVAHGFTAPFCRGPDSGYLCPGDSTNLMRCNRLYPCVQNPRNGSVACGLAEAPHYYPPPPAIADKNLGAPECPDQCFGDPINAGTGNKFETVVEYQGTGVYPLQFAWTYNSGGEATGFPESNLGRNRTHTFSRAVHFSSANAFPEAHITRPNGSVIKFVYSAGKWHAERARWDKLEHAGTLPAQSSWVYTDDAGNQELFDANGKLIELRRLDGFSQVIGYDSQGRISSVSDPSGRALVFGYGSGLLLASLSSPDGGVIEFAFSPSNDLVLVERQDGTSVQYLYDEPGKVAAGTSSGLLTGVVDESSSRYSTTTYDGQRRATSTFMGAGVDLHSATYQTSSDGSYSARTQISLPNGSKREVRFGVFEGRVFTSWVNETCPGCLARNTTNSHDANGKLNRVAKSGVWTDYGYDAQGLLRQEVQADGTAAERTIQTDWNVISRLPVERRTLSSSGILVSKHGWSYNGRRQVIAQSSYDPMSSLVRSSTTTFCEQGDVLAGSCPKVGLIKAVDGARSDVSDAVTFEYRLQDHLGCTSSASQCLYRRGDLWKVTSALGQTTETLAYDGAGRPLSVKDPNGVVTDLEYHPRGWLTARKVRGADNASETDDQITRIEYWPTGLVKKVIQPDGAFTSYSYDAAHRLTAIADNAGNRLEYVLDNAGNRIKEDTKDAGGQLKRTLSRIYNQLGQLKTQADAQANPTDFAYDAIGNVDTVTDALGRVTDNNYDPLNRLARTLQDVGGIAAETKFQYDALDNLTKVTDPKGLDTTYTYNGLGDLVQLQSPDTGTTTYTYDSAGNRASQTDARGVTTTYQYDALNRLTQVGYPDPGLNVSYTYDATPVACQAGETFTVGRLTGMQDHSGTTQYCHDRFGNLVRKVQVTNGIAFVLRYAYTASGQLQGMTYPDGTEVDYVRNALGQVSEVGVTRVGQPRATLLHQATYHPFGPVAGWTYGNGRLMQRQVDQDYRPVSIQGGADGLDLTFGFDAVGNLTELASGSPPPLSHRYDALGRLTEVRHGVTQSVIDTYAYDKTGNRTAYTTTQGTDVYTYPATSHRLVDVDGVIRSYDAAGNTLAIGAAREFVYNDTGRMSQVKQAGVVTQQYAYNGRGEQVRRYLGATSTHTLYDEAGHWLGDYDSAGNPIQQAIWMDDMPVGLLANGGQVHYVQPDHLGTPRTVIDPVRDVAVWAWDLKGEVFGNTPPEQDADGDSVPLVFDMRFPGQRFNSESGLNQNYFRDYDAVVGRYLESDPIGHDGGPTTYSYVEHSPLSSVDPAGLQRITVRPWWWPPAIPLPGSGQGEETGQFSSADPWDRATAADGSTARDWGRPVGRSGRNGSWCVIKCKAEEIGVSGRGRTQGGCQCPDFILGLGLGFNEAMAWNNAWDAANNNTPRGCMKKHCSGLAGSCRGWQGGKRR